MAVKLRKQSRVDDEIPSSSMSDIAFLLLIFFLVTTVFNVEEGIKLALPGQAQTQKINRKNLMHIKINQQADVFVNKEPVQIPQIEQLITDAIAENPKLIILLNTHEDAEYGIMVDVMDELKKAGATRISLKTSSTKGTEHL